MAKKKADPKDRPFGSSSKEQEKNDPYGWAMKRITDALHRALRNRGGMADIEFRTLLALFSIIHDVDPSAVDSTLWRASMMERFPPHGIIPPADIPPSS